MDRNKESETGSSECEVTKTRYLGAEELREIWDLSWKSSFQTKFGHVVLCNPHFSPSHLNDLHACLPLV